jgi:hypothetical protein
MEINQLKQIDILKRKKKKALKKREIIKKDNPAGLLFVVVRQQS